MLQDLNPLPFAATILDCSGWIVYTVLVRNWFVFCSDVPGLLCSIWMTFSLYPYASPSVSPLAPFLLRCSLCQVASMP